LGTRGRSSQDVWRCKYFFVLQSYQGARGNVVVKALCYKPEDRGFETQWGEWVFFSIYLILLATLGPGVHSAYSRNEYQK
jgi:hypothetical protein